MARSPSEHGWAMEWQGLHQSMDADVYIDDVGHSLPGYKSNLRGAACILPRSPPEAAHTHTCSQCNLSAHTLELLFLLCKLLAQHLHLGVHGRSAVKDAALVAIFGGACLEVVWTTSPRTLRSLRMYSAAPVMAPCRHRWGRGLWRGEMLV